MKASFEDRSFLPVGLALYAGALLGLFFLFLPDLQDKTTAEKADRLITLAADWEDVAAFSTADVPAERLSLLRSVPIDVMMLPPAALPAVENSVRQAGFRVLWRLDDEIEPAAFLPRFKSQDGIFIAGEHVLEHPLLYKELPGLLRSLDGFLCTMEFHPNKLLPLIAKQLPERVVKSHLLSTREIYFPRTELWKQRLIRAARERWVRLEIIRFSPGLSAEANIDFQKAVAEELTKRGFIVGAGAKFPVWETRKIASAPWSRVRLLLVLLISLATPVMAAWMARSYPRAPILFVFLGINALTLFSGVVIHALGSMPNVVLGLQALRGVKLQLVAPLALTFLVLFSRRELTALLDHDLKVKHVAAVAVFMGGLLAIYLMRSGNFPLIPVSNYERHLRDALDAFFSVRPRFKEFLIGQPLLLWGLFRRGRGKNFFTDGRVFLWLGMIGQVSILNTFTHFHSPFEMGLVRSLHGVWVGFLVAIPFLPWVRNRQ